MKTAVARLLLTVRDLSSTGLRAVFFVGWGEEAVMGRKKIVDVGWSFIGADMDRVEGDARRKEEDRRVREAVLAKLKARDAEQHKMLLKAIRYMKESGVFYRKNDLGSIALTAGLSDVRVKFVEKRPESQRFLSVLGERRKAEDVAWFYVNGFWPRGEVVFIDGNRGNLRIRNLDERIG